MPDKPNSFETNWPPIHIAPRGAKKEEAFCGVILKSERPSGALFTNSGPPFFTVESKIEVLSPLMPSFQDSGPHFFKLLALIIGDDSISSCCKA